MKNKKSACIVHINSTQNNTILTARTIKGSLIKTKSLGLVMKAKRGKKAVPQGALLAGESLGSFLVENGYFNGQVRMKGFGTGRENAVQGLVRSGFSISDILDVTSGVHNGCRPPKSRRL